MKHQRAKEDYEASAGAAPAQKATGNELINKRFCDIEILSSQTIALAIAYVGGQ